MTQSYPNEIHKNIKHSEQLTDNVSRAQGLHNNWGKFKCKKLNDKIIDFGSLKLNDEKHYFKKY
jgi:hypothetical protein